MSEEASKPRSIPKSGRFWKTEKTRFNTMKKSPGLKKSFEEKQKFREDMKRIKSLSRELIAQRKEEKEAQKARRRENIERKKENELKSEVLQVIKNPAKLKRMKKKQLRLLKTRDITQVDKSKK